MLSYYLVLIFLSSAYSSQPCSLRTKRLASTDWIVFIDSHEHSLVITEDLLKINKCLIQKSRYLFSTEWKDKTVLGHGVWASYDSSCQIILTDLFAEGICDKKKFKSSLLEISIASLNPRDLNFVQSDDWRKKKFHEFQKYKVAVLILGMLPPIALGFYVTIYLSCGGTATNLESNLFGDMADM